MGLERPAGAGELFLGKLLDALAAAMTDVDEVADLPDLLDRTARAAALLDRDALAHAADEARMRAESSGTSAVRLLLPALLRAEERLGPRRGGPDPFRARDARSLVGEALRYTTGTGGGRPRILTVSSLRRGKARAVLAAELAPDLPPAPSPRSGGKKGRRSLAFYRVKKLRAGLAECVEYIRGLAAEGGLLFQAFEDGRPGGMVLALVEDGRRSPSLRAAPFRVVRIGAVRLRDLPPPLPVDGLSAPAAAAPAPAAPKVAPLEPTIAPPPAPPSAPRPPAASPPPAPAASGRKYRVRFTIGLKLVVIIASMIALALSAMIFVATLYFRQDVRTRIEEGNNQSAKLLARQVEGEYLGLVPKVRLLLSLKSPAAAKDPRAAVPDTVADFFTANPEILFAGVPGLADFLNEAKAAEWGFDRSAVQRVLAAERGAMEEGRASPVAVNVSPYFGRPASGIFLPYVDGSYRGSLVVFSDVSALLSALKPEGIGFSFVVNGRGELLLHPDATALMEKSDYSGLPVVRAMLEGKSSNGQSIYSDGPAEYLGSYRRAAFASLGVVSAVPSALAFESVDIIQRRNLYIMGAVLSLAALLTYFYSRTISRPVGALMDAARQIEEGSFILDLVPTTRDELGALTATFVEMGQGLDRGRRLKDTFGKFVNKEIAERALNGELGLGGVRRQAVVFFSDIRRFTAISESLEPEEVVEFLNQYFTIMVGCIESTGGIVDKFIGDAVMAVWGVPEPKGQDGRAAADAALLMRRSLAEFNRGRGGPRSPEISIGCALNSGPVLAGQIGSEKRMEYTVIGDTVNLTSRIEALTKPFGVDILVSESLRAELGADYRLEPMPLVAVKGKTEVQRVYALLGKADDPASPRSLAELRASLGIEALELDLEGVHDGSERKYDIKGGPRP